MVRGPVYDENGIKRGAWSSEEDDKLRAYVERYGHLNWRELPKFAGLSRCGKSCRLRWMNYLRPDVKRGSYTAEEETLIIKLHEEHGNKWSLIATQLPGRTDNEIKNHWHTHLKKRMGITNDKRPKNSKDLSSESSQFDQTRNHDNEADQAESSNSNISLSPPIILESSQLFRADKTVSTNSSGSSFINMTDINNGHELSTTASLGEDNNSLLSPSEVCQEYCYSGASDFWTEPFLQDNTTYYMPCENEYQACFGAEGGMISPYPSFYDETMEYFCNNDSTYY